MLRRLIACACALALSTAAVLAQTGQGTSPLTGAKGGTNNGFMQFAGPASSMKTFALPNASGTIAVLEQIQTWTGAQSFADGKLILLGATSGSSTLKAPATGGGTATLFAGTDTIVGLAVAQTLTNKTMSGASNTFTNIALNSAVSNTLPVGNGGTGLTSYAQHDIPVATGATALAAKSLPDCVDSGGQHLNYTRATQAFSCGTTGDGAGGGGGGAWTNSRIAKTAAYSPVTGDCGGTLALGGGAFYGVTFDAPSGYAAACAFLVVNEDAGGGFRTLATVATSSTSITVGTGAKAFTTSSGLSISPAQRYRVYSLANSANYMSGYATYASTTFTLTVDTTSGSGTFTDWQIAPETEEPGRAKLLLPQFASSSTSVAIGTGAKAFTTSSGLKVAGGYKRYRVYSAANKANWMAGTASYVGTTFTLTVDSTGGSGTFTDWQIAPEIRLWPGQSRWIVNQNNVWTLNPDARWVLPGTRELCVTQNGSDSSDGLGPGTGCLAKIQSAITAIGQEWDGSGYYACNIGLYSGGTNIFNEATGQTGQSVGCYLTINVRSGGLTLTSSRSCFSFGDNAIFILDFRTVNVLTLNCNTGNTAATAAIYFHQTGILDIFGTALLWIPGGNQDDLLFIDAQGRGTISLNSLNIGDGAARSFNSVFNCDANCAGLQVSGSLGCAANLIPGAAFIARSGSFINTTASWPGCASFAASPISGNSKIITNGTTIPGGTSATTGGQVCTTKC